MGRVVVHLHGSSKNPAFKSAITDYSNRLSSSGVTLVEHSDKTSSKEYLKQISRHAGDTQLTLLIEAGDEMDSVAFSKSFAEWRMARFDTHLVVGPSDGFGQIASEYRGLSLSKMTMQHELAAVVLLEQLYRAAAMNEGKPYHRG
tara:strand:+ start:1497 stop:1931 length:435 start_codon:yes stop_codon:yes gene_type:complete